MNVLFLSLSRIESINDRGIYADLMRELINRGNNVYIASPAERRLGKKTHLIKSPRCQILKIKTLNILNTNVVEKGIGILLLESQFNRFIRKYWHDVRFDLVLYATPPITFNNVIRSVKKRCDARSYLLLKDIFPQNAVDLGMFSRRSLFYWMFRRKERTLYRLSDYIGCMSPANVDYVIKHNPDIDPARIHVNPNSIEVLPKKKADKNAIRQRYGLPTDKPLFIYGGNLGRPQGIGFLLQMLDYYRNDDDLYFVIAGNGTEYKMVESWFSTHKPTNARLQPYLPKAEYDLLVQSCDVGMIFLDRRFTIPNFPSRLLSYLEYRMPVMIASDVNTDIGRIAEENGFGLWSVSGDVEPFVENIKRLLDPQIRMTMGERGYRFLLDNYTVDRTCSIIINSLKQSCTAIFSND